MNERKIIHIDCDCFYAAVEMRDNPAYRDVPIAIGGAPDSRGVIATCNYPARAFGVHSAMPSAQAKRLCPALKIIPGRMAVYRQVSSQVMDIFRRYADTIEPLSLDEAFLDVTEAAQVVGSATAIAQQIRSAVAMEVGITVSAGVAPNKFVAKVASDWHKPNGLFVVRPEELDVFSAALPVRKIPGVGPVSAQRLAAQGIETCADLRVYTADQLLHMFGRLGESLIKRRYGLDDRPVQSQRARKSVSVETTFDNDMNLAAIHAYSVPDLLMQLHARWQKLTSKYVISGLVVKLKFADFTQLTRERAGEGINVEGFQQLLAQAYSSGSADQQRAGARLVGLGLKLRQREGQRQLCLFEINC
ncbi:MAG: DNA polymerase IV [Gammaproteobacteria bacterium]|nr:DNA polymerase IV [Gammaproteobacteria bacterium]MCP4882049.1 DNA polymerase IV [Gammaproteobacteria bacterium]